MALLHLDKLTIRYPHQRQPALRNVSLTLESGDRLALVGPSGCGKSTLARAVLGMLPRGSTGDGVLHVAGRDPRTLPPQHLRQHRGATVGLVFQDPMTRLNPLLTTWDHLLDLLAAHRPQWSRRQYRDKAHALLEQVKHARPVPGPVSPPTQWRDAAASGHCPDHGLGASVGDRR